MDPSYKKDLDLFSDSLRQLVDDPSFAAFDHAIKALQMLKKASDLPSNFPKESIDNAINYLNDNIKDNLTLTYELANDESEQVLLANVKNELREDALYLQSSFPFFCFQ